MGGDRFGFVEIGMKEKPRGFFHARPRVEFRQPIHACRRYALDRRVIGGKQQRLPVREIAIDASDSDARPLGDARRRHGVRSFRGHDLLHRRQQRRARLQRALLHGLLLFSAPCASPGFASGRLHAAPICALSKK